MRMTIIFTTHCDVCPERLRFRQGYAVIIQEILEGWGIIGTRRYRVCSLLCADLLRRQRESGVQ